jgi:nucleoside-diphosphate kinase
MPSDISPQNKKIQSERNPLKMERTLSIIKPDGVSRGLIGEVVKRFEKNDIKIVAMKMVKLTREDAEKFYAVHKERPFFGSLTEFMTSGPIVPMVLEGDNVIEKNRELMGATNYKEAAEGTIRRDFATDIEKNIVHGSDAPETAAVEIAFFFNQMEINER